MPMDTIPYISSIIKHTDVEDFSHKLVVFKEKFILMPTYVTFLLKSVEFGDDTNCCNIQATVIIRYASDVLIDFLLAKDYITNSDLESTLDNLKTIKVRVNEQEVKEFDD